jgi:hypothetical protein
MKNQQPRWFSLSLIAFVTGAALIVTAYLPLSPAAESWLLILWLVLGYGAVSLWLAQNRAALERAEEPRDCIGRPIMQSDRGLIETMDEDNTSSVARPMPQSFSPSEAI